MPSLAVMPLSHQRLILPVKDVFALDVAGVFNNALHGTNLDTLLRLVVADALSTQFGIDPVDLRSRINSTVRTLGLADVAIYALIGYQERHMSRITATDAYRNLANLVGKRVRNARVHKLRDIAAKPCDLLHQRR